MPILWMIGFLAYSCTYVVEKALFCHIYRSPGRSSTDLMDLVTSLLPLRIFIHAGMSIWMYTAVGIFPIEGSSISSNSPGLKQYPAKERVLAKHAFPLFIFILLLLILLLGSQVHTAVFCVKTKLLGWLNFQTRRQFLRGETGVYFSDLPHESEPHDGQNYLTGVKSYSILQNPKYQDLCGHSSHFADGYYDSGYPMTRKPKRLLDAAEYSTAAHSISVRNLQK